MILLISGAGHSGEFIKSYLPDSNAVALSAVENGRGGYTVLVGVKWGTWLTNLNYGLMEVDSTGMFIRYKGIFHAGKVWGKYSKEVAGSGTQEKDNRSKVELKDGGARDLCHGRLLRLSRGGYFAAVDSVYCYFIGHDMICDHYLIGLKVDEDFNVEWKRRYGGSGFVRDIKESRDSSGDIIIVTGGVTITRIDSTGNVKFEEGYNVEGFGDAIEWEDGGYILCGGKYVLGIDSTGTIKWDRSYDSIVIPGGEDYYNWCDLMRITRDIEGNGYKIAGRWTHHDSIDHYIGFILSIDDTGGVEWIRYYGSWFNVSSMHTVKDGYVVVISTNDCECDSGNPYWAMELFKAGKYGDVIWDRRFYECPPSSSDPAWEPFDGVVVSGGYLISGYHNFYDNRAVLIKTNEYGEVDEIEERYRDRCCIRPERVLILSIGELKRLISGGLIKGVYDINGREITSRARENILKRGIYIMEERDNKMYRIIITDK